MLAVTVSLNKRVLFLKLKNKTLVPPTHFHRDLNVNSAKEKNGLAQENIFLNKNWFCSEKFGFP